MATLSGSGSPIVAFQLKWPGGKISTKANVTERSYHDQLGQHRAGVPALVARKRLGCYRRHIGPRVAGPDGLGEPEPKAPWIDFFAEKI